MKIKKWAMACLKKHMQLYLVLFLLVPFLPGAAFAQEAQSLPKSVMQELKKAKIPADAFGIYIQPLSRSGKSRIATVTRNDKIPYVSASIMKIVTTYSALEILGPDYRWKTAAYLKGSRDGDVLNGDLIFKGSGDPKFNLESFWLFLRQIRSKGIREIRGDLILDRSEFEARSFDPAAFDDDPFRPYNAGPDALLLNHKVLQVAFKPDGLDGRVKVSLSPELDGVAITPPVLKDVGQCNGWQKEISLRFSGKEAVFEGRYPLSCGEQSWLIYPHSMKDADFFRAVFAALWKELGGTFSGRVKERALPSGAQLFAEWFSPPLREVIRDINKYSNNVMARHVLMTIGAQSSNGPANPEKGVLAVRSFLASRNIPLDGLLIENGSGLSRAERISPQTMGRILTAAYHSPVMQDFVASLSIAGQDGTLRRSLSQTSVVGKAHLKTGAIQDVRAIAGYVRASSGERYVVVFMVNHPNAALAAKARNALLVWIHDHG